MLASSCIASSKVVRKYGNSTTQVFDSKFRIHVTQLCKNYNFCRNNYSLGNKGEGKAIMSNLECKGAGRGSQ